MEVDARAKDAEQACLSAVNIAEQHSLYAKQANDRPNSFEQQAKHAQLAAQQAQHDAQQKASRVGELERLVEQLMQQVLQVLALHQAPANRFGTVCFLHKQGGTKGVYVHWSRDTLPAMPYRQCVTDSIWFRVHYAAGVSTGSDALHDCSEYTDTGTALVLGCCR